MKESKARDLITGEGQINEGDDLGRDLGNPTGPAPQRPGGPPRRPMPGGPMRRGPGGPGGPGSPAHPSGLNPAEQSALKDLVILDLLQALNNDRFYTQIANVALKGEALTPEFLRHIMDEAPKYAGAMSKEVNDLMGKLSQMPMA